MDKKTETVNTYNKSATALANKFNELGARVADIGKVFSYFKEENLNILEIGCGNGRDAQEILKHSHNYIGIDISEELIKIAKSSVPHGQFEVHDVEEYNFPTNLDIILAFASLIHINKENLLSILGKAQKALNDNGLLFLSLKYGDYHEETKIDEFGTRTYYFYTPEIISELAGDRFKVIYQDTQDLRGQKWFTIILQK